MSPPRNSNTQRERVLRALRNAGSAGVPSTAFDRPADGGKPIRRVAARIRDLRAEGHPIGTRRAENGTAIYYLAGPVPRDPVPSAQPKPKVSVDLASADRPSTQQAVLFDLDVRT